MTAGGSVVERLPSLQVLIAGYMVAIEIRRLIPSAAMDAMVRDGTWVQGIENTRDEVAKAVGVAFSWEAWQRGKVEAWRMYADERKGEWPKEQS